MTTREYKKLEKRQDKIFTQLTQNMDDSEIKLLNELLEIEILLEAECNQ